MPRMLALVTAVLATVVLASAATADDGRYVAGGGGNVAGATGVTGVERGRFTGKTAVNELGRLEVTFRELAAGSGNVSYRLQAQGRAWWTCGGSIYGSTVFGGESWRDPNQSVTITAVRGVVTGSLWHERLLGATPPCPADESGVVRPATMSSIEWTKITVTSSSGRVLTLRDTGREL